jgi:hypothetical protein
MPAELLALHRRADRAGRFELGQPGGEIGVGENVARPAGEVAAGNVVRQ